MKTQTHIIDKLVPLDSEEKGQHSKCKCDRRNQKEHLTALIEKI